MTIHSAITYFDSETKSIGYMLGSDSAGRINKKSNELLADDILFQSDKSFKGKNTIGFIRGTISGDITNPEEAFSGFMKSLENIFDDIDEGSDYSNVPLLQSSRYALLIGKQTTNVISIYAVSNIKERNPNMAKRLYRLTPEMFDTEKQTKLWYAPNRKECILLNIKKKCCIEEAQLLLEESLIVRSDETKKMLNIAQDYTPGKLNIYRMDFQGIKRIEPKNKY